MIETTGNDLVVIASDPQELAEGQTATVEKVKQKESAATIELRQARATLDAGTRAGINVGPIKSIVRKAEYRVQFLGKVIAALEAGYVIVPNFSGDTIAIRVKRGKPRHREGVSSTQWGADRAITAEQPDSLPIGEGRYVNPTIARVSRSSEKVPTFTGSSEMTTIHKSVPTAFADEIGLPVEFLRPTVVERTGVCMARKIFDEVAISQNQFRDGRGGGTGRKGDPMVIGRIIDRSKSGRILSFLVAWFVDTSAI